MSALRTCGIAGCDAPHWARGLCNKHYQAARKAGMPLAVRPTQEQRFWAKVEKTETCWLWTGCTTSEGYGSFRITGATHVQAHRIAYAEAKGPIPEGLHIDHLCRVRNCVNPAHMEAVPCRVNVLRGISPSALAARQTECHKGHPFDEENTYFSKDGRRRRCKKCRREWVRARQGLVAS